MKSTSIRSNFFVEKVLPGGMRRVLTEAEMDNHRAPNLDPASRRPVLAWLREIPTEGNPAEMARTVSANQQVIEDLAIDTLLVPR